MAFRSAPTNQRRARMLLARLHMDALQDMCTVEDLGTALAKLPTDLDAAFEDTIDRIKRQPGTQPSIAHRALMWIVGARRPLTVKELKCAVALKLDSSGFSNTGTPSLATITSVCAGLLIVDKAGSSIDDCEDAGLENSVVRLVRKSRKCVDRQ